MYIAGLKLLQKNLAAKLEIWLSFVEKTQKSIVNYRFWLLAFTLIIVIGNTYIQSINIMLIPNIIVGVYGSLLLVLAISSTIISNRKHRQNKPIFEGLQK